MGAEVRSERWWDRWALNLICALPVLGWLTGHPTIMVICMVLAAIAALPYFADLAQAESNSKEQDW